MDLAPAVATAKRPPFLQTFQALRYRDFRLFWTALLVSLLGLAFQTVAQGWLVYRLTNSPMMLGLAGFIPAILAAPGTILGGIIADRVPRRKLVMITQAAMMFPPLALAYLVWTDQVAVWHVIAAGAATAILTAIDTPARTALIPQLVGTENLMSAQGLNAAVYQMTRIVGPALAGFVIASAQGLNMAAYQLTKLVGPVLAGVLIDASGEAICFLVNGLSYGAMVIALMLMSSDSDRLQVRRKAQGSTLLDGVHYILRTPVVLGLLVLVAIQSLFLSPYVTLLPVYARDILKVGAVGLGWLNTAVGIGAFLGALGIAGLSHGRRGPTIFLGSLLVPLALLGFGWSQSYGFSLALLLVLGLGSVMITTVVATAILEIVPDEVRGRVNSLGLLVYFGGLYSGGLPAGFVAEHWGPAVWFTAVVLVFWACLGLLAVKIPDLRRLK